MATFTPENIPCPHCPQLFRSFGGRTRHIHAKHTMPSVHPIPLQRPPVPSSPPSSPRFSSRGASPPLSPLGSTGSLLGQGGSPAQQDSPLGENTDGVRIETHPILDGTPCDRDGYDLPPGAEAEPWDERDKDDFGVFESRATFEFADFLYTRVQMSGENISQLMQLFAAITGNNPPFANDDDLYATIDSIPLGDIPWQSFSVQYNGPLPDDPPLWMTQKFQVWFRSPLAIFERQLANPDFKDEIDWAAKRIFRNGKRQYTDVFSGNWVWERADLLAQDPENHGALHVPIITGSDKTCASVGTGNTEFYPFYGGIANYHNEARRGHRNGIALLAFLSIPKTSRQYADSVAFRKFRRQLFHSSIAYIMSDLKPHMKTPKVTRCCDRHFRRAIYDFCANISDYPEQVLYTCIVQGRCPICLAPPEELESDEPSPLRSKAHTQTLLDAGYSLRELWDEFGIVGDVIPFTNDFPRADIHELISPDLLHQMIKGVFKDHLVDWIVDYIATTYDKQGAQRILADIDRRIAVTPPFPGLRNFPMGRNFKQWTGDDSKGLMKVFLPAISGRIPSGMVRTVSYFMEFCYLARRSVISEDTLKAMETAWANFHEARESFRDVRPEGFSLPRQHSGDHYVSGIRKFGVANGLCSSISVKKPWRRSNRNQPLGQMLLTNQRLDKLHAARVDFAERGMLDGPLIPFFEPPHPLSPSPPPAPLQGTGSNSSSVPDITHRRSDDDSGPVEGPQIDAEVKLAKTYGMFFRKIPRHLTSLAIHLSQPRLPALIRRFLFEQIHPDDDNLPSDMDLEATFDLSTSRIYTYTSARAVFHAPSDICGIGGMRQERVRATATWFSGAARYDCALVVHDRDAPGIEGFHVARVRLFFSFKYNNITYPCALVHWFSILGDSPEEDTGMWVVTPDWVHGQYGVQPDMAVIHLDSMLRGVHLIPVFGESYVPEENFDASDSLDAYQSFYVSKYADYHANETIF
ncbi:hypothetical protein MIND_00903800 [Mycena indigotica]|uniref:C2H2-type domain-containing protein n=1 Tax=Mycena indigotica TaxID=2126181 RepID=A0A8H6VZ58_9AGAR|nr:uncharacterized protein MIND_00903800 [Mycena indigotica]KAF7299534.1 hypothetical protein MIND_00903800 [Mycena indigotica]